MGDVGAARSRGSWYAPGRGRYGETGREMESVSGSLMEMLSAIGAAVAVLRVPGGLSMGKWAEEDLNIPAEEEEAAGGVEQVQWGLVGDSRGVVCSKLCDASTACRGVEGKTLDPLSCKYPGQCLSLQSEHFAGFRS